MASHNTRSRLATIAALMLAAFIMNFPLASGQEAVPAEDAIAPASVDPWQGVELNEQGDSIGVAYPDPAHPSHWLCFGRRATKVGTPHDDVIRGTKGQDVIVGLGGDDIIYGGQANDRLCGGKGDDQLYGLEGSDFLDGEDGNDSLFGGNGDERMLGRGGDDTINGEGGADQIYGGAGEDTLNGGYLGGSEASASSTEAGGGIAAADSNDLIKGGPRNDTINGGDGNDNLYGQGGNDTLQGDDPDADNGILSNDRMQGGPGRDVFIGGPGADTMTGGGADDIFSGEEGDDTVWGDGGRDIVNGGPGRDSVHGGSKEDVLNGEGEGDTLWGDGGDDILCGGEGQNTLSGGEGGDLISGDATGCTYALSNILSRFATDSDSLNLITGGKGADLCVSPSMLLSPQTRSCEFTALIKLTVVIEGNGNVTSNALGILNEYPIDCSNPGGGVCTMYFLPGEVPIDVDLSATPGGGSAFLGWSGPGTAGCGSNPNCTVTVTKNTTVTATFDTAVSLTVVVNGAGSVTGPGIACPGDCSQTYAQGASVSLTASVGPTSWVVSGPSISSGCTAGNTACNISMGASGSVTANLP